VTGYIREPAVRVLDKLYAFPHKHGAGYNDGVVTGMLLGMQIGWAVYWWVRDWQRGREDRT
jgi:hypothetical protein